MIQFCTKCTQTNSVEDSWTSKFNIMISGTENDQITIFECELKEMKTLTTVRLTNVNLKKSRH